MKEEVLKLIIPDQTETWSLDQLPTEIPGFDFKGPGWYLKKEASMLILSTQTEHVYDFLFFFDRDPRTTFYALGMAPVLDHSTMTETNVSNAYDRAVWTRRYYALVVIVRWAMLFALMFSSNYLFGRFGFGRALAIQIVVVLAILNVHRIFFKTSKV